MNDTTIPACAGPDPVPRASKIVPPPGACDCHAHVFGPVDRFPYVADRSYTPPEASYEAYRHMLSVLGLERAVIVQPSVHGTDNRVTMDAVARAGGDFRAVVVVDDAVTDRELEELASGGARGVRLNLLYRSGSEVSDVRRLAERVAPLGWHLQMLIDVSTFGDLRRELGELPVKVVFDHMGHLPAAKGTSDPGFTDMLAMIREGRAWAKLSGAYRFTGETQAPYADVVPFARAIVEAGPDRCVWATDWPHPSVTIPMPNDGALLDMLADWVPDEATRNDILVANPAKLYGFA